MKRFLLLYLLLLITQTEGHTQNQNVGKVVGTYGFTFDNPLESNLYCEIQFSKLGKYQVDLTEHLTDDILQGSLVSCGDYIIQNDTIIMHDAILKYSLKAVVQGTGIQFVSGFQSLLNRTIKKTYSYTDTDEPLYGKTPVNNHMTVVNKLVQSPCNSIGYPNIQSGVYASQEYRLILNADHTYRWDIMNQTISVGKWSQQGYVLTLIDAVLNYPFHAIVSLGKLQSMLLPGEYEGINLTKRN